MGIQINKELPSGVVVTYVRVDTLNWAREGDSFSTRGVLGSYLSKAAADEGRAPVLQQEYHLITPISEGEPTREAVYRFLTDPVRKLKVPKEEYGQRDDGSYGQILSEVEIDDPTSITGFNDAVMI